MPENRPTLLLTRADLAALGLGLALGLYRCCFFGTFLSSAVVGPDRDGHGDAVYVIVVCMRIVGRECRTLIDHAVNPWRDLRVRQPDVAAEDRPRRFFDAAHLVVRVAEAPGLPRCRPDAVLAQGLDQAQAAGLG